MASVSSPNRKAPLERYRNFGIAAHIDGGKTTLSERILFYTGMIHKIGEVHDGAATTDWMEQEQERGITITSAAVTTNWKQLPAEGCYKLFENENFQFNVIDTPGHVDFTAEVERSLRVLDGAIVVFCGVAGVQPQTQTVWRQATKYNVPRMCFVNKMDRTGANFDNVLNDIRTKLGANAAPILIPIGAEDSLCGQIDVVNQKAIMYADNDRMGSTYEIVDIPEELKEKAALALEELKERVADVDDELGELFLFGKRMDALKIRTLSGPVTLAVDVGINNRHDVREYPAVAAAEIGYRDTRALFLVNSAPGGSVKLQISGLPGEQVEIIDLFTGKAVTSTESGSFETTLAPYEVKAFQFIGK